MKILILVIACLLGVHADIYLHNPRGSNNRLNGARRDRANANRLFDSQNNNRGGYNVGNLYYYAGSKLPIEWTNQHSCNHPNANCEIIIQYMCGPKVRDGTTVRTIPTNQLQCQHRNCDYDGRYGMHEDFDNYLGCLTRQRNQGLFTADQKLRTDRAISTRQNPNNARRGYECAEERDYYPYWHPSQWRDIAILTNNASRCDYYKQNSQNVKPRSACVLPREVIFRKGWRRVRLPLTKAECEKYKVQLSRTESVTPKWVTFDAFGLPAPECREGPHNRDNHLGNTLGGETNVYNWTVPDIQDENCVMRIRYNISTNDYDAWNGISSKQNAQPNPQPGKPTRVDISKDYGFTDPEGAVERGYIYKNDPVVKIFPGVDFSLQLALNTAQFGRTFQDRSHRFAIRKRPETIPKNAVIHNLNVRGKRGNIVQTYPATEYDFTPNKLQMNKGDYVHFQWTGSNTNPRNNAGEGTAGTDRSNVVLLAPQNYAEGSGAAYRPLTKYGHLGRSYPPNQFHNYTNFMGLSGLDLGHLALIHYTQFGGDMQTLNDAGTYFDLGPRKITKAGAYNYFCTRNNNFSNRSQKGTLICNDQVSVRETDIGYNGGEMETDTRESKVKVEKGTFENLRHLKLEEWTRALGEDVIKEKASKIPVGDGFASKFVVIYPQRPLSHPNQPLTVSMKVDTSAHGLAIYHTNSENFATWTRVDAQIDNNNNMATFKTHEGGVFVARYQTNVPLVVGMVITLLVFVMIVVGSIVYFRKYPEKWESVTQRYRDVRRSMTERV